MEASISTDITVRVGGGFHFFVCAVALTPVINIPDPSTRQERDPEGKPRGRIGGIELLNSRIVSTQPVVGWDWSADKEGLAAAVCLDQTLRVFIVSRLGRL